MKNLILKLNHWLFAWFYRDAPLHRKKQTFFKAVGSLMVEFNILKKNLKQQNIDKTAVANSNLKLRGEIQDLEKKIKAANGNIDTLRSGRKRLKKEIVAKNEKIKRLEETTRAMVSVFEASRDELVGFNDYSPVKIMIRKMDRLIEKLKNK